MWIARHARRGRRRRAIEVSSTATRSHAAITPEAATNAHELPAHRGRIEAPPVVLHHQGHGPVHLGQEEQGLGCATVAGNVRQRLAGHEEQVGAPVRLDDAMRAVPTLAGHLFEGKAAATCELIVRPLAGIVVTPSKNDPGPLELRLVTIKTSPPRPPVA